MMVSKKEQGMVLIGTLILLLIMGIGGITLAARSIVNQETSASAQHTVQALYYAESGINYVIWALRNDAELDGTSPPIIAAGIDAADVGDWTELFMSTGNPGPTSIDDTLPGFAYGQLEYFDNRPLADRDYAFDPYANASPSIRQMSKPKYLILNVVNGGEIVLGNSVATPVTNSLTDTPYNGAIVWLTAAVPLDAPELLDMAGAVINDASGNPYRKGRDIALRWPPGGCTGSLPGVVVAGCVGTHNIRKYGLVAYSIGYVEGQPSRMVRQQIGLVENL